MRKVLCLVMVVAALMFFGCAKSNPEDVAKDYVNKEFSPDAGVTLDTTELEYKVIKEEEDNATIKVSGSIHYSEVLYLIKVDDKWEIKGKGTKVKEIKPEHAIGH